MAASFLDQFINHGWGTGAGGIGQAVWNKAIAAGYSGKQIAVASHKLQARGVTVGAKFDAARKAAAAAAKGSKNNWIHNYTGGSGALGLGGLQKGLAEGRTMEEMKAATAGLHRANNTWGVAGMGQGASLHILQTEERQRFLKEQELENQRMRDQMDAMQAMYSNVSKSAPYAVGTGGNASLTASAASKGKSKASARRTFGRGGTGFKASVNAPVIASGKSSGSAASKSLNV